MSRSRRPTHERVDDPLAPFSTVNTAPPPWILGMRGSPLEAPENSLAGFRRALELGLDGFAADARATSEGEIVLIADAHLERTTNGRGLVREATLREIAELDAGGTFDARFRGERVPLLSEALELRVARASVPDVNDSAAPGVHSDLVSDADPGAPLLVVIVHERADVARVADLTREAARRRTVRVASRSRDACSEARDRGLAALWIADAAGEREFEIVRDAAFDAIGAPAKALAASPLAWPCERWATDADEPEDLRRACRTPLFGVLTNEPTRALAARVLARLAPHDDGPWPVLVPELEVVPGSVPSLRGDWSGAWDGEARVRNPFPFTCRVACGVLPRRGAFDIEHVPVGFVLEPGEERDVPFSLRGGSWRPGGDPLFHARYRWRAGPGRPAGALLIDAPLVRVRRVRADALAQRLVMLRESPTDPAASMTLRRQGRYVYVAVENPGGLKDARALLHVDGREVTGSRGARAPLPADFDTRPDGVAFSCGFVAWKDGERVVRRFAGGLPAELDHGSPGRLLPLPKG